MPRNRTVGRVRASARNPPVRTPVPAGYASLNRPTRPPPNPLPQGEGEYDHSLFRKTPSPLVGEGRGGGGERLLSEIWAGATFILLVALGGLPPAAVLAAPEPLTLLKLLPAWDGWMQAGATTELGIELVARRGGAVTVTVSTSSARVQASADMESDQPLMLWLPLRPTADSLPLIEIRPANGEPQQHELTSLQARTSPLVAVVQTDRPAAETIDIPDGVEALLFRPSLASLPRTPQAYNAITVLMLDIPALAGLEAAQQAALQAYLAACGRLLASGSPEQVAILQQQAGCQGRFVRTLEPGQSSGPPLRDLLREPPPALPGVGSLRELPVSDRTGLWPGLILFWLAYAISLLLLVYGVRQPAWLLSAPGLATVLALAVWGQGGVESRLVSWAEITSGDTVARYVALLRLTGAGRGEAAVTLSSHFGLPWPLTASQTVTLEQDRRPSAATLRLTTRLLAEQSFWLAGAVGLPPPLTLALTRTGPSVRNEREVVAASGVLGWEGRRYTVPPLAPGERWSPPVEAEPWGNATAEQWLRARSINGAALLLPFTLQDAGLVGAGAPAAGWLLIRPPDGEQGA